MLLGMMVLGGECAVKRRICNVVRSIVRGMRDFGRSDILSSHGAGRDGD